MAFRNTKWYAHFGDGSTTGYYAVTVRPQNTAVAAGVVSRQFTAPAVGSERCFACIVAGTTANTTDATWTTTHGAKTTDGGATWIEVTGQPGVNGDTTNCPVWAASQSWALGEVIYDSGTSSIQVCTTAGSGGTGSTPSFSATAGVTTADASATWTSLGLASAFGTWASPYARIGALDGNHQNVLNNNGGHTIYVADNSAETYSAVNPSYAFSTGSYTLLTNIISIDHTASLPVTAPKAGASVQTLLGAAFNITQGMVYWYGLTFIVGSGANAATLIVCVNGNMIDVFDNCSFQTGGTAGGSNVQFGNGAATDITLIAPTFKFGAVTDYINVNSARVRSYGGGSILGTTFPTTLIKSGSTHGELLMRGFDFSALGSGKKIITPDPAGLCRYDFIDCKLGASVSISDNATQPNGGIARFIRCDSAGTNYTQYLYTCYGTQSVETTIVRTGGATDGTTAQSWKIVTTANPSWQTPFCSDPLRIWNSITGLSKTLTIYGIWGGGAVPNNDDIWIEVDYLGDIGDPLGTHINSTKASILATNAACSTDTSTWGGSTTKFKMTVTITPQQAGYVNVRVKAAKVSSTFYIDPLLVLS